MLRGTLAFLLLVGFAVVGDELGRRLARRGLRAPALEGASFLLLGMLLGEQALGLLPGDVVASLRVVVLLGLAWIGLTYGLQVDLGVIRHLQPWHRALGLGLPVVPGAVIALVGMALGLEPPVAVGLAAVGALSAPSALDALARARRPRDRSALRLLKLVMAFSGIPAIAALAVAITSWQPLAPGRLAGPALLVTVVGVGVVAGYALLYLIRGVGERIELLSLLIGMAAVVAGLAGLLGACGLPAAALAGAVLVNRCFFPHKLLKVAHSLERPMLVALLVLVGATWRLDALAATVLLVMTAARLLGVVAAGRLLAVVARRRGVSLLARELGLGLLPQGELALGLLVALAVTTDLGPGVFDAVVVAMLCNHALGHLWMRRELFASAPRAKEVGR